MSTVKRSRNGCLSCKKLKIKCNEAKPSCEYCVHTSRVCNYPGESNTFKYQAASSDSQNFNSSGLSSNNRQETMLISQLFRESTLNSQIFRDSTWNQTSLQEITNTYKLQDITNSSYDFQQTGIAQSSQQSDQAHVLSHTLTMHPWSALPSDSSSQSTQLSPSLSPSSSIVSMSSISTPQFQSFLRQQVYESRANASFDQFVYNQILISPYSQLSVTKFEYRLLSFFENFCVPLFSFGVNVEVDRVWKNEVPTLFMKSPLVRSSIFSFAALNLLPLCDLNLLDDLDNKRLESFNKSDQSHFDTNGNVRFNPLMSSDDNLSNLHKKTTNYFLSAINSTNSIIGDDVVGKSVNAKNASELTVSSVLLFSYLCMQPDNVTPLVCWDRSEADLISITGGIRVTLTQCAPILIGSNFSGLFFLSEISSSTPPLNKTTFPFIRTLLDDLSTASSQSGELQTEAMIIEKVIEDCLLTLHTLVYRCVSMNYPIPLYRWLLLLSESFRELIYKKHFFVLRVLYTYACLALLLRFELYSNNNIWIHFILWYKQHNWELFGDWKYPWDASLFRIVHDQKYKLMFAHGLASFDPDNPVYEHLTVR